MRALAANNDTMQKFAFGRCGNCWSTTCGGTSSIAGHPNELPGEVGPAERVGEQERRPGRRPLPEWPNVQGRTFHAPRPHLAAARDRSARRRPGPANDFEVTIGVDIGAKSDIVRRLAARYSGVNMALVRFTCFLITGVAAALSGMLHSGMMQTARYNVGTGGELAAIAPVILGGTSLFGGKGTIIGTFVGALLIGTIDDGLIIMGLDASEQNMVAGAIIILAVAFGREPAS